MIYRPSFMSPSSPVRMKSTSDTELTVGFSFLPGAWHSMTDRRGRSRGNTITSGGEGG